MNFLIVIVGAAFGASLRYFINTVVTFGGLPYATLLVNVLGSFLAGILVILIFEKSLLSESWRLFLLVGFLGSLTTFSTFSFETMFFFQNGEILKAVLNIGSNIVLSLVSVFVGAFIGRVVFS